MEKEQGPVTSVSRIPGEPPQDSSLHHHLTETPIGEAFQPTHNIVSDKKNVVVVLSH